MKQEIPESLDLPTSDGDAKCASEEWQQAWGKEDGRGGPGFAGNPLPASHIPYGYFIHKRQEVGLSGYHHYHSGCGGFNHSNNAPYVPVVVVTWQHFGVGHTAAELRLNILTEGLGSVDTIIVVTIDQPHPVPAVTLQDLNNGTHLVSVTRDGPEEGGVLMPVTETGARGKVAHLTEGGREGERF